MSNDTIFCCDHLPKRRLIVRSTLGPVASLTAEKSLPVIRWDLSRRLADICMECEDLVKLVSDNYLVKVSVDCIVLSSEELDELLKQAYLKGLNHLRISTL